MTDRIYSNPFHWGLGLPQLFSFVLSFFLLFFLVGKAPKGDINLASWSHLNHLSTQYSNYYSKHLCLDFGCVSGRINHTIFSSSYVSLSKNAFLFMQVLHVNTYVWMHDSPVYRTICGQKEWKINSVLPSVFPFFFHWNIMHIKCMAGKKKKKHSATVVTPTTNTNQPVFCTHLKHFRCQTPVMPPHYQGKKDEASLGKSIFTISQAAGWRKREQSRKLTRGKER